MTTHRLLVLSLYRNILRHIQLLKPERKISALQEARTSFREHKNETDPEKIQHLIKIAEDKLGFLRVITPRRGFIPGSAGNFIVREGELVRGRSAPRERQAFVDQRIGYIDPDDLKRHIRLLRRQHFLDRHLPLRADEFSKEARKQVPWDYSKI